MTAKIIVSLLIPITGLILPAAALAHCPLCTIGAGAAAVVALGLGVEPITIGIFIGAFAVALGLWVSRMIKKKYLPKQNSLLVVFSFITTVFPLKTVLSDYTSLPIFIAGDYGTFLNRTYLIDRFVVGAFIGGAVLFVVPLISKFIVQTRKGKLIPFQGIIITFILLTVSSLIVEIII